MDTEHQLGNTCSRKAIKNILNTLSNPHTLSEATKSGWFLVLITNDFTKIHTNRRPNKQQMCSCISMCTIAIKAFKSLKAVKLPKDISKFHDHNGINLKTCIEARTSQQISLLSNTYSSTATQWLMKLFFTAKLERHILEHPYCNDGRVCLMKTMENLHLINFVELQLKSKEGVVDAYDIA